VSFDYNPYKHMEIVLIETEGETSKGRGPISGWTWHCHSCGGHGNILREEFESLQIIFVEWQLHISQSHGYPPEFFKDWSTF